MEGALRLQQRFGPLYNFEFANYSMGAASELLNHVPVSERIEYKHLGLKFVRTYDDLGIERGVPSAAKAPEGTSTKVLFMGDSFIQGFGEISVPQFAWEWVRPRLKNAPLRFLNAGSGSYSPAIYIPQARFIIPKLNPDLVVVDIDETDVGNDAYSYEPLVERDASGQIERVRPSEKVTKFFGGLARASKSNWYVGKFLYKFFHTHIYMPMQLAKLERSERATALKSEILISDVSPGAPERYQNEIALFERNVGDLMDRLVSLMRTKDRILFINHPHLYQVIPSPTAQGRLRYRHAATVVKRQSEKRGIAFYDATDDLLRMANGHIESFYFPSDMHLNPVGIKAYGTLVGQSLLPLVEEFRHSVKVVQTR